MGVSRVISLQEVPAKLGGEPPNYHTLLFFSFIFFFLHIQAPAKVV